MKYEKKRKPEIALFSSKCLNDKPNRYFLLYCTYSTTWKLTEVPGNISPSVHAKLIHIYVFNVMHVQMSRPK